MSEALRYPATRFDPSPLPDLSDPAERERLTAGALRAFFKLMQRWRARDEDARQLLDGLSNGRFYEMKRNSTRRLDQDSLARISYLIGIYKALHTIHGDDLADRWPSMPNTNPIFGGLTPLAFMTKGGLPAFQTVRRLLDARRGGA